MSSDDRRLLVGLIIIVFIKLLFHALYLPAWEGPDEPFHLGRIMPSADAAMLQTDISRSVAAHPCADDLRRVFECQAFDGSGAFNVLDSTSNEAAMTPEVANYEAHQPPTYYILARGVLFATAITEPISALLTIRLLSVALVMIGVILIARIDTEAAKVLVFLLLLPGASESLARVANDPLVFAMSAALIFALERKTRWLIVLIAALAPTVKLTIAPLIAAAVIWLWLIGERRTAIITSIGSMLVVPLQAARGWAWGGTVELNQAAFGFDEPFTASAIGLVRSIYTVVKTTIWLGNWTFFSVPLWLIVVAVILAGGMLARARVTGKSPDRVAFIGGLAVLVAGVVAFAVAHRSLFGQWGGVGGWYIWGIAPWLSMGLTRNLTIDRQSRRVALFASVSFLLVINVLWIRAAYGIYGFA